MGTISIVVFMLMTSLSVMNWILACIQKDMTRKIVSVLAAIYFLLFAIIIQLVSVDIHLESVYPVSIGTTEN
jgi:hypothetical protein